MASVKRIIPSIPTQQAGAPDRSQSSLDWNRPKTIRTPRSEYSFMRQYSMVWAQTPNSGAFGPSGSEASL
jgi:hypothetical protein